MNMMKKTATFAWVLAALLAIAPSSQAQPIFPNKSVRIVVPFAPGGSSDSTARVIAEHLTAKWKQPVIIDNKPGAGASIGSALVAKSPADGHTLLLTTVSIGTITLFQKNPGFDPLKDLLPVSQVAQGDYVLLVNKNFPANSMAEFGSYTRKNPTKVFHGAFGGGAVLAFEQLAEKLNFKAQNVSYRGESPAITALISEEVQAVLSTLSAARPFIDSGRVKALGIPAKNRSLIAPDIKTSDESGAKGFYVDFWFGLMVPVGTPEAIVKKVNADVAEILARTDVKARLYAMGLVAHPSTPEGFAKLVKYESERWVDVAKRAGVQPQ